MGSSLSPVVANVYMEKFEKNALRSADLKPRMWLRCVGDMFILWTHGCHWPTGTISQIPKQAKLTNTIYKRRRKQQ